MSQTKPNSSLYAMSAHALSKAYRKHGQFELQERYLLIAAMSDVMSSTNESLALQDVALLLFKNKNDLDKAQQYINLSLKDANVMNNRLRRVDLSNNFNFILSAYADKLELQAVWHKSALACITVLLGVVVFIMVYVRRKNRLLKQNEQKLKALTEQLYNINSQQEKDNKALTNSNTELTNSNTELSKKNTELTNSNTELTNSNTELSKTNTELTNSNTDLSKKNTELSKTNTELTNSNTELTNSNTKLSKTNTELSKTNTELSKTNTELSKTNIELSETNIELTNSNTKLSKTNLTDRLLTMTICLIRLILLTTMVAVCLKIASPQ
jgi:myosin heavy subunit